MVGREGEANDLQKTDRWVLDPESHSGLIRNILKQAFEGFTGQRKFASPVSKITEKFAMNNGGTMPAPGSEFFTRIRPLQKNVKEIIMNEVFPSEG